MLDEQDFIEIRKQMNDLENTLEPENQNLFIENLKVLSIRLWTNVENMRSKIHSYDSITKPEEKTMIDNFQILDNAESEIRLLSEILPIRCEKP